MRPVSIQSVSLGVAGLVVVLGWGVVGFAQSTPPVLSGIHPWGGEAGATFEIAVSGTGLDGITELRCNRAGIRVKSSQPGRFVVTIPAETPPGWYELRAGGPNGLSAPRTLFVSRPGMKAPIESEPNDTASTATGVAPNVATSGRIEKPGDVDHFRFEAAQGTRLIVECWADRVDSALRPVLEIYDAAGRRLQVSRGYFGIDPLIDFIVPADGTYIVKLFDLVYSGSPEHFYRLDIDAGPRVLFAIPNAVERGKTSTVTLYGWNLEPSRPAEPAALASAVGGVAAAGVSPQSNSQAYEKFEQVAVQVTPPQLSESAESPARIHANQVTLDGFAYSYPASQIPLFIGITDVPVTPESSHHASPATAQPIGIPADVSGQLIAGDEQDWFSIEAQRGEVIWLEAFGERLGSPVDLDLSVLDDAGAKQLAHFTEDLNDIGGTRFPSRHLDPSGRWVAPADGHYLLLVRNLIGGIEDDPRRIYRLSLRRETPDVHFVMLSERNDGAVNVPRGGREMAEVLAYRQRGASGSIRISAHDLPPGIECPDVWFGPGMERVPLIFSASPEARPFVGTLHLTGSLDSEGRAPRRAVRGTILGRSKLPKGSARITAEIPLAVAGEAPWSIDAKTDAAKVPQGSVVDVSIDIVRRDSIPESDVELTVIGLPESVPLRSSRLPTGRSSRFVSFSLPAAMIPGKYSFVVRAETTVLLPADGTGKERKPIRIVTHSNPITLEIYPAPFLLEVDPQSPRQIRRGKIAIVKYAARRRNGFIGKIHTDLAAPGGVVGVRGRGVTFVGQTETGELQIIANDDAPLGQQPFLQLHAIGTVEDQPIYHSNCFLELEVVD